MAKEKRKKKESDNQPPSLFDFFRETTMAKAGPEDEPGEKAEADEVAEDQKAEDESPSEDAAAEAPEKEKKDSDSEEEQPEPAPEEEDDDPPGADLPPGKAARHSFGGKGPMHDLIDDNFLQFASYTICNRAIPTVEDGLKPVQRRIMHSLWEKDDGRFIKVANIVGHTMQYHPHGDASIGEAVVNLVNRRGQRDGKDEKGQPVFLPSYYLVEGQGNYGNLFTRDPAAAPRYIECRLTELARKEVFSPKITAFIPSYDGRNKEPVLLPAKLPLLLMMGADGIAVGLSTSIFPHNFCELLEAEVAVIQKKPFALYPDFLTGGIVDVSEYADGMGRIKVRATIEPRDKNKVVITSLPWGQTTETLISSIEDGIKKKKIPARDITDFTAGKVEIEVTLSTGASQEKAIQALYAFTACESTISSRPVVLYHNRPREMSVSEILRANVEILLDINRRELEVRAGELDDAFHTKTLEQIFIEERIYKRIEEQKTYEAVQQAVLDGFVPFRDRLRRDITKDDVEQLLQIKIRRISRYDIEKNRKEIEGILKEEAEVQKNLKNLKGYTVSYLKKLIKQYGKNYPRQSKIAENAFAEFSTKKLSALTASELSIRYDAENGYIGTGVRGGEELFKCSSLDKLLVFWNDGLYKMIPPPDKFFVDKTMALCQIYNRDKVFTVVYTDPEYGFTYLKRFSFGGSIQNKEYHLVSEKSKIIFFAEGTPEKLYVKYKPSKGQRIGQQAFTPSEVPVHGVNARGKQMTAKKIARITAEKPRGWDSSISKGLLL